MTGESKGLVILDRDGVVNFDSADYIKSADEWRPIPGSIEAIADLSRAGFEVYLATNQAGIGRGLLTEDSLSAIHQRLVSSVEAVGGRLAGIQFCPHHPEERCECRKPGTGMVRAIEAESGISARGCPFIGDSLKDIRAAESAGCVPVLVLTGNGTETHQLRPNLPNVFDDLRAVADQLLSGGLSS